MCAPFCGFGAGIGFDLAGLTESDSEVVPVLITLFSCQYAFICGFGGGSGCDRAGLTKGWVADALPSVVLEGDLIWFLLA